MMERDLLTDPVIPCPGQQPLPMGKVRHDHPDTSREAAERIAAAVRPMHQRVLDALKECGPRTDEQLMADTGLPPSTLRPRRVELVERGMVIDSGERGRTQAGRSAILWKLTDRGWATTRVGGDPT
jgi:hypothetical protein